MRLGMVGRTQEVVPEYRNLWPSGRTFSPVSPAGCISPPLCTWESRTEGSNSPWNSRTRYYSVSTAVLTSCSRRENNCSSMTNNSRMSLNAARRARRSELPIWEPPLPVLIPRWRPEPAAPSVGRRPPFPSSPRRAGLSFVGSVSSNGAPALLLPDQRI
jgi:hypothetical protein